MHRDTEPPRNQNAERDVHRELDQKVARQSPRRAFHRRSGDIATHRVHSEKWAAVRDKGRPPAGAGMMNHRNASAGRDTSRVGVSTKLDYGSHTFNRLTEAAEIPASRASSRTPFPEVNPRFAFSNLLVLIGGLPNLTEALRAVA
jgi:hypothetical protein